MKRIIVIALVCGLAAAVWAGRSLQEISDAGLKNSLMLKFGKEKAKFYMGLPRSTPDPDFFDFKTGQIIAGSKILVRTEDSRDVFLVTFVKVKSERLLGGEK